MKTASAISENEASRHDVQSVRRAMQVLSAFSVEHPRLGVAEIAQIVGLNRTTVHRLVATLEASGLIRRDPVSNKYTLSARVLHLADVFLQQSDLRSVAQQPLTTLRDSTNETAALHQREGSYRLVINQIGANRDIRHMYRNIGEPIPLHLGAPGKVILAFSSPAEITSYLDAELLESTTPHSITDPKVLREELEAIAQQGYAVSWEERTLGVVSLAAPIFDATGTAIASVNVSGPSQRIRKSDVRTFIPLVIQAATEISQGLGYRSSPPAFRG